MTINAIYLDGFKNLCNLKVDLAKINTLLSTNNYGKSNVLTAIQFAFDFISSSSKQKNYMMKWNSGIPFITSYLYRNFKFEMDFEPNKNESFEMVKYGFEFEWSKNSTDSGRIINEYLKVKPKGSQKFVSFIEKTIDGAKYKSSKEGRCDKKILVKNGELIINKLLAFDDLFYLNILEELNSVKIFIDRHFDPANLFKDMPFIFKDEELNSPFSDNSIARTLYYLKTINENKYELIINTLMDFFPNISKVEIKEINLSERNIKFQLDEKSDFKLADYMYYLYVTINNLAKTVSFELMSDGVKRILSLLTYMALSDMQGIPLIGIEEPENSIHPGLLKKYIDVIEGFMDSSKIIITSHSPYLINYTNLLNLYIGKPNDNGEAVFKKITQKGINKINQYVKEEGMQTGEYLFSTISGIDSFDTEWLRKYLENE